MTSCLKGAVLHNDKDSAPHSSTEFPFLYLLWATKFRPTYGAL